MRFFWGQIDVNKKQNNAYADFFFSKNNLSFYFTGKIYSIQNGELINRINMEYLYDLYVQNDINIFNIIIGDYTLCIEDNKKKILYLWQGDFTSSDTLYYRITDDRFIFSISLKKILGDLDIRLINEGVINEFITQGYIIGKQTIVKEIYKWDCSNILKYDFITNSITEIRKEKIVYNSFSQSNTIKDLMYYFDNYIKKLVLNSENLGLALSSGFDSNYLLFLFNNFSDKKIKSLTVGGEIGKNEIDSVQKIVKNYSNIQPQFALVSNSILYDFPDMIWKLEGVVFVKVIFLSYALSQLAEKNFINTIVTGEGNDEVSNWELKYNFLVHNIMKKSSCFFRTKDIEVIRPYLDNYFAYKITSLNFAVRNNKKYLKNLMQDKISPIVYNLLSQKGGSVDYTTVISTKEQLNMLKNLICNSYLFGKDFSEIVNYNSVNDIQMTLGLLYVIIFNQLFLSKEFDFMFECNEINIRIHELL